MLLLMFVAACGREAPTFAPGDLTVTSTPAGAAIFFDGQPTGETTPHIFAGLPADLYVVTVRLPEFVSSPGSIPVELAPLDDITLDFALTRTAVTVDSRPEGARILVDGVDTGLVTPATIAGLEPGAVDIALLLDTYYAAPAETTLTVIADSVLVLPVEAFALRPQRTVLLEGFSNTNCPPCPQLANNLVSLAAKPEFPADRLLYLEYSVNWPNPVDPLYQYNPQENTARFTAYRVLGAPALFADGSQLEDALDAGAMEAAVRANLAVDPGFFLDVQADFTNPEVPVTVNLVARSGQDLTGYSLSVALYEKEIDFVARGLPVGSNGQQVFHHVFRDRSDETAALGPIAAGTKEAHHLTVTRGDWPLANLVVVAIVQNDTDFSITQAGSYGETAPTGGNP